MKTITKEELQEILEAHKLWIDSGEQEGCRADLSKVDLSRVDLSWTNLREIDLSGADLSWTDLTGADLTGANLSGAYLQEANLQGAYLSKTDLRVATAKGCVIYRAEFSSPKDRARLLMLGAREEW